MENNNKSQAEIYREERKERLAKAATKNAKKKTNLSKPKKVVGKVIAVILAVVVALGTVGAVLNFFGTPQKSVKIKATADKTVSFTPAEFNYFYYMIWQNVENTAYQAESTYSSYYGAGAGLMYTGYDYSKSPADQAYLDTYSNFTGITLADLGATTATWADVLKYAAISQLVQTKYGALMAAEAGIKLTEEQKASIESEITDISNSAKSKDYSVNRYLRKIYGNGITETILRGILADQILASAYFEKNSADVENSITKEQIEAKYNEDPDSYNIASLRVYTFTAEYSSDATDEDKAAARDKAKANAQEFLDLAINEGEFISLAEKEIKKSKSDSETDADDATAAKNVYKSYITSSISEEAASWAMSADRQNGDKQMFTVDDDYFHVIMVTVPTHKDTTSIGNDVRHILIKFPETDADGNKIEITDDVKAAVKAKADEVLDLYLQNPTEENFINLTNEYSEDVDTEGNLNNGGLYEGITSDSSYVKAFLNWSIDEARKPADVEIVETEYGYHLMYYVKSQGETWEDVIKTDIVNTAAEELADKIDADYLSKINMKNPVLQLSFEQETKLINNWLLQNLSRLS